MDIEVLERLRASSTMTPRPVWRRHLRRTLMNVNPLPPATEEEKADAIRVLAIPDHEQYVWQLWVEACRILDEEGKG